MRLGELIGIARECKGWTLRDLEKATGVSNALISQIETGKIKGNYIHYSLDMYSVQVEFVREEIA